MIKARIDRSREKLASTDETNCLMEYYRPLFFRKKKDDEDLVTPGTQHLQSVQERGAGDTIEGTQYFAEKKKYPCFRCERHRLQINGARFYKQEIKKDGSAVSRVELIAQKFEELKIAK